MSEPEHKKQETRVESLEVRGFHPCWFITRRPWPAAVRTLYIILRCTLASLHLIELQTVLVVILLLQTDEFLHQALGLLLSAGLAVDVVKFVGIVVEIE